MLISLSRLFTIWYFTTKENFSLFFFYVLYIRGIDVKFIVNSVTFMFVLSVFWVFISFI